ncbi:MAG: tetratricopeptide repeat protein [Armatimonadota bacterium]
MNRRSGLSRHASALLLLVLLCAASAGEARATGSVLLYPLNSHWLSQPLADATTAALSDQLSAAGYAVTEVVPNSPVVQLAVSEEWIPVEALGEKGELVAAREALGIATGADAALYGEVVERETEVSLKVVLSGTISRRETELEVSAPRGSSAVASAAQLAEELVVALTPMTWGRIGADAAGKRAAAAERYAAGQAAVAAGMYREAVLDFEAALLVEPANPRYLQADAGARQALGDYSGAVVRMKSLAAVAPSDAQVSLQLGNAALEAGRPEEAEAAFLSAAEELGRDPQVVEGLALACKEQGKRDRAEEYYQVLIGLLPALTESPPTLAGLLANSDVSVRLTDVPQDEIGRPLGEFYLENGYLAQGIAWLLAYQDGGTRPPYSDDEYLGIAPSLDEEASGLAEAAEAALATGSVDEDGAAQGSQRMDGLHERSDRLATLAERMQVSAALDPAHRYRVLAYNLLNQSNFEGMMYLQTNDADRLNRSDLLREAFRKSLAEARRLTEGLAGSGALGNGPAALPDGSAEY